MAEQLFSGNLRFLRKKGGHNQDEISILFNKRPNTIGNWENRKSEPSLSELIRLGEFFQVSVSDLLHRDLEKEGVTVGIQRPEFSTRAEFQGTEEANRPVYAAGSIDMSLIMRELRLIQERIDALTDSLRTAALNTRADKSSH